MFGNSDFRLKGTEMIGFSNLGMVSSSFESNGSPIEAFLGGDQKIREIPITYYEIFQTQFK